MQSKCRGDELTTGRQTAKQASSEKDVSWKGGGRDKAANAHAPDSETTAFNSWAMYCTGVPFGGVERSCTRDLTTSVGRDGLAFGSKGGHNQRT